MAEEKKKDIGEVRLKNVRLSFADIFRAKTPKPDPETGKVGPAKFGCNFLMSKSDAAGKENIAKIKAAAEAVKKAKWGQNIPKLKPEKVCLRDGDLEDWDGYSGMLYVSASNTRKPTVVDRDRSPLDESAGKPYAGCYVNAVIRLWAMDNEHGKRLNASLEAIQFVKHGDAFGAKPVDANDVFDDLSDDDDDLESIGSSEEEEDSLI